MEGAGEEEDVITTVAELSPRSVVSLSSVRREASKIIPPHCPYKFKMESLPENCISHSLLCQR